MERKISYLICGAAAAVLVAAFVIAENSSKPQDSLRIRVQPAAISSVTATAVQTTTTRFTKTTAAPKAAAASRNTVTMRVPETTTTTQTTMPIYDLNAADIPSLMRVDGVGEGLAAAIVRYREEIGGFVRRSQLMDISGIGETLMSQIMAEFEITGELPETGPPPVNDTKTTTTITTEKTPPVPQNLNEIGREALLDIPEMTEQLADEILDLRGKIKAFHTVYELCLLDGISEQFVTERICPYLYIENDTYLAAKK